MKKFSIFILFLCINSVKGFEVLTQNLWHYRTNYRERLDNSMKIFELYSPDIVLFQEGWIWGDGSNLYDNISKSFNYEAYVSKTNNVLVMKEGMVTLSKNKIKVASYTLPFSKIFSRRVLQVSAHKINNKQFYVFNLHLSPFPKRKKERVAQLRYVVNLIQKQFKGKTVILAGDFNQRYSKRFFKPLLEIGFLPSEEKNICTICSTNPYAGKFNSRFDYIFYQPLFLKLQETEILPHDLPISDHYGRIAKFQFKKSGLK